MFLRLEPRNTFFDRGDDEHAHDAAQVGEKQPGAVSDDHDVVRYCKLCHRLPERSDVGLAFASELFAELLPQGKRPTFGFRRLRIAAYATASRHHARQL